MASISSPGIGSGLDINGIITKLMQVESQPLTVLASKEASFQAQLSAFGSLKGALSSLQAATQALGSSNTFTIMSPSVSDPTAFTASSDTTASVGSYDISVTKLAKNHIVRSNGTYTLADTFKGGTLAIQLGSTAGVGGTTTNVTIADGSTLATVRDTINTANAGVKASIVNDGTTNRLILTSSTTGSTGNIRITAAPTGSSGTQNLTDFDYAGLDTGTMVEVRPPDNAVFDVNGLTITRSSNVVTDAISGVTLNLAKEGGIANLTVAKNTSVVNSSVNAFVKAYNDAIGQIKNLTSYDATNKKASTLTGDGTARNIQTRLANLVQSGVTSIAGGIARLSDIGVSVQKDGTLALDSGKLSTVLADSSKDVTSLFTQITSGNEGIAVRFNNMLQGIVGSSGFITSRTDGINTSIKELQKRADSMNLRLANIERRYRAQFSALDTLISSMNQTSSYLTQQLANLPGASSK